MDGWLVLNPAMNVWFGTGYMEAYWQWLEEEDPEEEIIEWRHRGMTIKKSR